MAEEIIQQEQQEAAASEQSLEQLISGSPAYQEQFKALMESQRKSWAKEQAAEQSEAQKLSRMSAEQRERYQFQKDREAFELEKTDFKRQQLTLQMGAELQKLGYSADMADMVVGKDAEESFKRLSALDGYIKAEIQKGRSSIMRGRSVPAEPRQKMPQDAFLAGFNS